MYNYLLDFADRDTVAPARVNRTAMDGSNRGLLMSDYQKERQRVYDRADHMVSTPGYAHPEVECAKAEAALVRSEARISRARGDQLAWLKIMLRHHGPARYGYRHPVDLVVSRLDVPRLIAHRPG